MDLAGGLARFIYGLLGMPFNPWSGMASGPNEESAMRAEAVVARVRSNWTRPLMHTDTRQRRRHAARQAVKAKRRANTAWAILTAGQREALRRQEAARKRSGEDG